METIKIYEIDELEKEIQERIIEEYRNSNFEYFWHYENKQTLEKFAYTFNFDIDNYSLGDYRNYVNFSISEDLKNLEYLDLHKYLLNNHFNDLYKPKYIGNSKKYRYSKVLYDTSCVLTGYYMDDCILKPLYDFIKKPCNITFEDLIESCIDEFIVAYQEDYERCMSDECIKEHLIINEYMYTASGIRV